ncbi:hypothetical protein CYY_003068 [Polysphondylium violaceum]|uniref:protein-tyrosine-phosphatase n=1 Tax=Polysphondylium violaceum TaxID=133409 RepID=A0A8J4V0G9_9MYCE|nr:hypothetical protein CYY_003068 [Polysphondylium violaceum]
MVVSTIIPNFLYLGKVSDTIDLNLFKQLQITHIFSCAGKVKNPDNYTSIIRCNFEDEDGVSIGTYLEDGLCFIENARLKGGRVFVHCLGGISRSPSIILAYLMYMTRYSLKDIYLYVHQCRNVISPNNGFMLQLLDLEMQLLGTESFSRAKLDWKRLSKQTHKTDLTVDSFSSLVIEKPSHPIRHQQQQQAVKIKIDSPPEYKVFFESKLSKYLTQTLTEQTLSDIKAAIQADDDLHKKVIEHISETTQKAYALCNEYPFITWRDLVEYIPKHINSTITTSTSHS